MARANANLALGREKIRLAEADQNVAARAARRELRRRVEDEALGPRAVESLFDAGPDQLP